MIPSKFDYLRPTSLDEAVHVLGNAADDAKVIAGGQSLPVTGTFPRPASSWTT